jgi:hypothetical protein
VNIEQAKTMSYSSSDGKIKRTRELTSYLKARARAQIEGILGEPWQAITDNYNSFWEFDGSVETGSVTVRMASNNACRSFGGGSHQPFTYTVLQRELLTA